MSKNAEKIVQNVQKPGKIRQKFGKTLKRVTKFEITWKKPSKM